MSYNFKEILKNSLSFKLASKVLPTKGNLVYEYNPFRNYRLTEDRFEYDGQYFTLNGFIVKLKEQHNIDQNTVLNIYKKVDDTFVQLNESSKEITINKLKEEKHWEELYIKNENQYIKLIPDGIEEPILREDGELVDFITDELSFDLEHPVNMLPQYSYDDSVNLVLNDGKNKPRLINSRFSAVGRNRYQIVDRKGDNDTNIYDQGKQFDTDTSLYKQVLTIPKLVFQGVMPGGDLPIGNYHFYFRYIDADGNETDFVAESGLVSMFMGTGPSSVRGSFRQESSHKMAKFILSNVDPGYQKVSVYYTRASSDIFESANISTFKINQPFSVNKSQICEITISGFEDSVQVSKDQINPSYQICDNAYAQASCQNMLFLANVQKPQPDYADLQDVSLHFLPFLGVKKYETDLDVQYKQRSGEGYTDPTFIYNFTGYWDQEIYRLGIVYILSNNTLSPVFNIRGAENIEVYSSNQYSAYNYNSFNKERTKIGISDDYLIIADSQYRNFENSKGVITFKDIQDDGLNTSSNKKIFGIDIRVNKKVLDYLQTEHKIKGFFFVRQKRISTTLCQALTIGVDKESNTPVLPMCTGPNNQIITQLNLTGIPICRNKKTGEIIQGDTLVKKPTSTLNIIASVTMAIGMAALGGLFAGVAAGVITHLLIPPGYDYAYRVYANNDKWEVYNPQTAPSELDGICYIAERFITDEKQLDHDFNNRIYFIKKNLVNNHIAICPDYDVNSPYYNTLFSGDTLTVVNSTFQPEQRYLKYDVHDERHFFNDQFVSNYDSQSQHQCKIIGVEDNTKKVGIDDEMFSARAGEAEEAFRYEYLGNEEKTSSAYNLVRGSYGPYLAINGINTPNTIIDIKIPGYNRNNLKEYFQIRYDDKSAFYAISDRIDLNNINEWLMDCDNPDGVIKESTSQVKLRKNLYRGDCYICQFTHRVNRNFQDPSAPINDKIVDPKCWAQNYEIKDGVLNTEAFDKINLGDVNAVQLGMWVTSTYRSSRNLNIRNLDESIPNETALTGHPRGFYPYYSMSPSGPYKTPEALCYNAGYEKSVSERWNFEVPDAPAIRNNFSTRILYSDIQITDAFKNGFRVFRGTHYRDYPITYGSITKLIESKGDLVCIFEHGVAIIPVNERALAGEGSGGKVYINTSNVLPENPLIISDVLGSQWPESVIKTNSGNIYGVDTVAKKIWKIDKDNKLSIISDFLVQEFLNQNISLTEREITPVIGIRNVKTHFNSFKQDVMFTFYDNTYGYEEKVWNLCYNEFVNKFITFYSWVPSFSENIYNTYFSFDRNTSKWIAKLGQSKQGSDFAQGITIDNYIIKQPQSNDLEELKVGTLSVSLDLLPELDPSLYSYSFELEEDRLGNYRYFDAEYLRQNGILKLKDYSCYRKLCTEQYVRTDSTGIISIYPEDQAYNTGFPNLPLKYDETKRRIWIDQDTHKLPNKGNVVTLLNIRVNIEMKLEDGDINIKEMEEYQEIIDYAKTYNDNYSTYNAGYYEYVVAVIPEYNQQFLSTDFWKHGQSGIIDLKDFIKPTHWYGKQHPFELEFIVNDEPTKHKIFDNLEIISNKAEPHSFHYEIVGECYDFAKDKKNMYIRQEATKELYQENGYDTVYDHDYINLESEQRDIIKPDGTISGIKDKSTLLPLYYSRQDTYNEIEDAYHEYHGPDTKDFQNRAGGEIVRYETLNEYRLWNHTKAVDIRNSNTGRLRGNMQYKEDKWDIQINPLNIVQRNEVDWGQIDETTLLQGSSNKVPVEIGQSPIPDEVLEYASAEKGNLKIPDSFYTPQGNRGITNWNFVDNDIKEVKLKDKWMKVRIRYTGKDIAIITAIKTLYTISYS